MTVEIKHKKTGEPLLRVNAITLERADLQRPIFDKPTSRGPTSMALI